MMQHWCWSASARPEAAASLSSHFDINSFFSPKSEKTKSKMSPYDSHFAALSLTLTRGSESANQFTCSPGSRSREPTLSSQSRGSGRSGGSGGSGGTARSCCHSNPSSPFRRFWAGWSLRGWRAAQNPPPLSISTSLPFTLGSNAAVKKPGGAAAALCVPPVLRLPAWIVSPC